MDIAWEHATREGYYDYCLLLSHYDFMFDLAIIPGPPHGWECSPEFDDAVRRLRAPEFAPMFATSEFVPFGALGDDGYTFDVPVGWRHQEGEDGIGVPAPADTFADREPDWNYTLLPSDTPHEMRS